MRYRRRPSGPGGDAFTNHKPRNSNSSSSADNSLGGGGGDPTRVAIMAEHARKIEAERRRILGEDKAIWDCRCSSSILAAVFIWCCIGLFVFAVVSRKGLDGAYVVREERALHQKGQQAREGDAFRATNDLATKGDANTAAELPDGCKGDWCRHDGGAEAFGVVLGSHDGVAGFSNCYSHTCISMLVHTVELSLPATSSLLDPAAHVNPQRPHDNGSIYQQLSTGMKWQCVEYARRYWMLRGRPRPAFFGSVEGAADIWDSADHATYLDGTTTPLLKYANGQPVAAGGSAPRLGDLVIYPRDTEEKGEAAVFPYGHVAVVVGVDVAAGLVYIAEQNWSSQPWPGPHHNYSRTIPLLVRKNDEEGEAYEMVDSYHAVQGWVRYGDKGQ